MDKYQKSRGYIKVDGKTVEIGINHDMIARGARAYVDAQKANVCIYKAVTMILEVAHRRSKRGQYANTDKRREYMRNYMRTKRNANTTTGSD